MNQVGTERLWRLPLRFEGDLEEEFQRYYIDTSLTHMRVVQFMGLLLYASFGILDAMLLPTVKHELWLIRYTVVCPIVALSILASFWSGFRRYHQAIIGTAVASGGVAIVYMIAIAPPPGNTTYYAGLILVIQFACAFCKLRAIWANAVSFIIVISYIVVTVFIVGIETPILVNNCFFFVSTVFICGFSSYLIELHTRLDFLSRCMLEREKRNTLLVNERLLEEMARRKQSEQKLAEHRDHLEDMIAERTLELRKSNELLKREIEQRRRTEVELNRTKEVAEEANRHKSEFLANVSHEIRTPMNGIIGMTDLALATELNGTQREYLTTVLQCSESLLALLNDILDFSKVEAGKMSLEQVEFDLTAVVEGVVDLSGANAERKGLELMCRVHPDVPCHVYGDPTRVRQVLSNLVGNAVKFTETGHVAVSVEVTQRVNDQAHLAFAVQDSGIGVPPDRIDTIFESFTQADGAITRKYGGTGLGLSICKQLVQLMGGTISVESEVGWGSTFRFEIPCTVAGTQTTGEAIEQRCGDRVRTTLAGKRILVVDPRPAQRNLIEEMLRDWACRTQSAAEASDSQGIMRDAAAQGDSFSLVIVTLQVAEPQAQALQQQIRDIALDAASRIVFLCSGGQQAHLHDERSAPDVGWVKKPIKQSALLESLVTTLAGPQARSVASAEPTKHAAVAPRQILLVDDNPVNQKVAAGILAKYDHQVTIRGNGREALEALEQSAFDIVLMDVQMPEMDGLEATRRIRENDQWKRLPIIAMTAHASTRDRDRCLETGMNDYLCKPIHAEELHNMVEKWADRQEPVAGPVSPSPASSPAPGSRGVPLDVDKALLLLGGDRDVFADVLTAFLDNLDATVEQMEAAMQSSDGTALYGLAHRLRGGASAVAAEPIRTIAERLEELGRQNQVTTALGLLDELKIEVARLHELGNPDQFLEVHKS
jgi:signal transduction histidine kinase/DNA-binding response OmpR family regulator